MIPNSTETGGVWENVEFCTSAENNLIKDANYALEQSHSANEMVLCGHLRQLEVPEIWLACCAISASAGLLVINIFGVLFVLNGTTTTRTVINVLIRGLYGTS